MGVDKGAALLADSGEHTKFDSKGKARSVQGGLAKVVQGPGKDESHL